MRDIAHIFRAGRPQNILYAWFPAMHTRIDAIFVSQQSEDFLLDVVGWMMSLIRHLEQMGDCFNPDSELSVLNGGRIGQESLSRELRSILVQCEGWRQTTGGLFDVTVEGRTNLSGYLKGYALDRLKQLLEEQGVKNALLNMGNSSIMAMGECAEGNGWRVVNPETGQGIVLHDECLTTSGNDSPGRRHIIDPQTGQYVEGKSLVSVITKGGAEGEVRSIEKFIKTNHNGQKTIS